MTYGSSRPASPLSEREIGQPRLDKHRMIWDTADVPIVDRAAHCSPGLAKIFGLGSLASTDEDLSLRLEAVYVSTGASFTLRCSPLIFRHSEAALVSERHICVYLLQSGRISIETDDKVLDIEAGQLGLYGSTERFTLRVEPGTPVQAFGLLFNRVEVGLPVGCNALIDGRMIRDRPLWNSLIDCILIFIRRFSTASIDELGALYQACLSVFVACLIGDRGFLESAAPGRATISSDLLAAMKDFIVNTLGEPDLTPLLVANKFGISLRYVHKLFESDHTTFSRFVLNERMERVRQELMSDSVEQPLSTIMARYGFRDRTSFYRNFKRKFGLTPNQMRKPKPVEQG